MPLVRMSFMKGNPEGFGKKAGEIVYRAMVDTINVPEKDHYPKSGTSEGTFPLVLNPR